jgi:hypothetical protein
MLANIKNDIKAGVKEHNVAPHIDVAVGSIINALLFGYRFEGVRLTILISTSTAYLPACMHVCLSSSLPAYLPKIWRYTYVGLAED